MHLPWPCAWGPLQGEKGLFTSCKKEIKSKDKILVRLEAIWLQER